MKKMEKFAWLVPMVLAFVVHISILKNGFVDYDDKIQILENLPRLTSFYEVWYYSRFIDETFVFYRPTVWVAFMLTRLFSGYEPWGYHLVQVLLHTINSGLVYCLAWRFLKDQKYQVSVALITAALFAVHPVHIEVVAWISAMPETLFTLFFLLALIFHIQSRDALKRKNFSALAALSFFLALVSKETAMAFLILAVLYDVVFIKPTGRGWKNLVTPYFFYGLIFPLYIPLRLANVPYSLSSHIALSPMEGFFRLVAAFGYYFQKVLWPVSLNPNTSTLPTTFSFLCISIFFLILMGFFCVYTFRFSRVLFFHILFYLFCLAPSTLISLSHFSGLPVAERYLYLPLYGVCFIFGWGVMHIPFPSKKIAVAARTFLISTILITGAFYSYTRGGIWQNAGSFWLHIAKMNSQNFLPWVNLAGFEVLNDNCAQASVYLDEAAARQNDRGGKTWARFYYLRAICAYLVGAKEEAINLLKKSLETTPLSEAYFNLGMAYYNEFKDGSDKNLPLAKDAFESALGMDKNSVEYAYHLGLALEAMGDINQAKHYYERCVASGQKNKWPALAQERLKQLKASAIDATDLPAKK